MKVGNFSELVKPKNHSVSQVNKLISKYVIFAYNYDQKRRLFESLNLKAIF